VYRLFRDRAGVEFVGTRPKEEQKDGIRPFRRLG
jgi:hypothetical protein